METTVSFGYWIRRQRKALDLTQQVLAERVGCSVAAIKKIESDERRPSRQIAERMAEVLGVPTSQREIFLEAARGLRPVDQLLLAREPAISSPPSGTVTFLYTDIEGSTKLAQEHPEEWETLRARHHAILRQTIESNNGYVFQVVGDGFCAAFHTPNDGFHAAIEAQRKLQTEIWGEVSLKVRMGIHTGEAEAHGNEYHGYLTLSLVQRLMSAGHGGQILLSHATENLLRGHLVKDVSLLDLGEYKFKDILQTVQVFQVIAPDLQKEFPALRAPDVFPNNLPVQLTSFIGREHELSEIKQLLTTTHLLTLTGPGGTGKTRLALQLAADLLGAKHFADGVWLVELAPLADPTLVTQTVAATLGVREQPGRTILDSITDYVRAKSVLLILDNCEHLIHSCARLADTLLRAAPRLKILATSREALGITGETAYRVPSLPLPDPGQLQDLDALAQNDCVHLFLDRALAAYPSFRLKGKNAPAIANICRRLDGIPLALELAAARTKVFPPEEVAARLDDRFRLLTGGSRTALERHQTLFALIEWSHNLLSEPERVLLRRLSVFAGGWSFEAAQEVCGDELGDEVLDLLTHLVDKSLVAVEEETEEARYRLPETIRQYARDKLLESGEAEQVRDRHLEFFIRFAEAAEPKMRGAEQLMWFNYLETEHDNIRTALDWAKASGSVQEGLRLADALRLFWRVRGHWSEGRKWLTEMLTQPGASERTLLRAKALAVAASLATFQGHSTIGQTLVTESIVLCRELGVEGKRILSAALATLGWDLMGQDANEPARAAFEESLAIARQIGYRHLIANSLYSLGAFLREQGDYTAAQALFEESLAIAQEEGDRRFSAVLLNQLGFVLYKQGDYVAARSDFDQALIIAKEMGDDTYHAIVLLELGDIELNEGHNKQAQSFYVESLRLWQKIGDRRRIALSLECFAALAAAQENPSVTSRRAAKLLGAAEKLHESLTVRRASSLHSPYDRLVATVSGRLGETNFETAWAQGRAMTLEQAIEYALETESEDEDSRLPEA